jgi:hypothetical protein
MIYKIKLNEFIKSSEEIRRFIDIARGGSEMESIQKRGFSTTKYRLSLLVGTFVIFGCNEKDSIQQPNYGKSTGTKTEVGNVENPEDSEDPKGGTKSPKKGTKPSSVTEVTSGESSQSPKTFDICIDGLKKLPAVTEFNPQVKILCDEGFLDTLLGKEKVYTGGDRKLFELNKKLGDLQTSFAILSGGVYDSLPEDYWNLLKLQFINPSVFRANYLNDPNAKMNNVVANAESSSYLYENNSGEGGLIKYNAKTTFSTLKAGKAWVASTIKVGPTIETMEEMHSLQIVFASDSYPGKTALISISDQIYKHASGQGQSYYDRAMNNLTTEQKNGFTNAKTATKAKDLLGK